MNEREACLTLSLQHATFDLCLCPKGVASKFTESLYPYQVPPGVLTHTADGSTVRL